MRRFAVLICFALAVFSNFATGSWFGSFFGKKNEQKNEPSPLPNLVDQSPPIPPVEQLPPIPSVDQSPPTPSANFSTANSSVNLGMEAWPKPIPRIVDQKIETPKAVPVVKSKPRRHVNASTLASRHAFDNFLLKKTHESVEKFGSTSELIFVGDLLFYRMSRNRTRWPEYETKYAAINLGSPADRTEHLLHRYNDGNILVNITAKSPLVVAMIGNSNVNIGDSPASIVAGVTSVIPLLKSYLNSPKIVILSLPPRVSKPASEIVHETNKLLKAIYASGEDKSITYLDLTPIFMEGNNTVQSAFYGADKTTPNAEGQVKLLNISHNKTS